MAFDVVAYAQFLERREQRRTADRGRAFPGAIGTAEPSEGGGTVIDTERIGRRPIAEPARGLDFLARDRETASDSRLSED